MSSNFEIPPQELYVDWPEQPWPRLSGQLDRKQLRRELLDVLKHLSNKAKLRIGPSGTTSKKVHYACESRYTRLIASDCVALAVITRKRLEADKPAGYCGHIAPKSGRIYPDKPNYFTQFWKRSMPGLNGIPCLRGTGNMMCFSSVPATMKPPSWKGLSPPFQESPPFWTMNPSMMRSAGFCTCLPGTRGLSPWRLTADLSQKNMRPLPRMRRTRPNRLWKTSSRHCRA